jgi:hypothetical protein
MEKLYEASGEDVGHNKTKTSQKPPEDLQT